MRIQWAIGLGLVGICGFGNAVSATTTNRDRPTNQNPPTNSPNPPTSYSEGVSGDGFRLLTSGGAGGSPPDRRVSDPANIATTAQDLNLPPTLQSPTLKKWRNAIPNLKTDIATDPAFRTRFRLGYESFGDRSSNPTGWQLGLEDLRIGQTRATFNAHYRSNSTGRDRDWGADVNYSLMPLGKKFQLAPTIGYRRLTVENNATTGLNLGLRTRLILSRRSGADITFDQSWVAPGSDRETGLSRLSFGYAITKNVRIATDWQRQRSSLRRDDRFGLAVEWMP